MSYYPTLHYVFTSYNHNIYIFYRPAKYVNFHNQTSVLHVSVILFYIIYLYLTLLYSNILY